MHLSLDVLKSQREAAEKEYNDWLTRLDALHRLPIPHVRNPAIDEALRRLNDAVRVSAPPMELVGAAGVEKPPDRIPLPDGVEMERYPVGIKGRIKSTIRTFVIRLLQLDDRLAVLRRRGDWAYESMRAPLESLEQELARLAGELSRRDAELAVAIERQNDYRSLLTGFLNEQSEGYRLLNERLQEIEDARIRYCMSIMSLVDTKDRELNGLVNNHVQTVVEHTRAVASNRIELLSGRVDVLLEVFDRKLEKMMLDIHEAALVRDGMYRDLQQRLTAELEKTRELIGVTVEHLRPQLAELSTAVMSLKRIIQAAAREKPAVPPAAVAPASITATPRSTPASDTVDDYKYTNFERRYRGSETLIRERFTWYVRLFEGLDPVLDAGCGRGEFLELLQDRGISCYGVDVNEEMVVCCREKGIRAERVGMIEHLESLADESLGGLFCAQVVEHIEPRVLLRFLDLAFFALRKGGRLVIETINPRSLYALLEAYYRDLSHVQPIHPDTLQFFAESSGFVDVSIYYRSPVAGEIKLTGQDENTRKLNHILFGEQDYALVATKL